MKIGWLVYDFDRNEYPDMKPDFWTTEPPSYYYYSIKIVYAEVVE